MLARFAAVAVLVASATTLLTEGLVHVELVARRWVGRGRHEGPFTPRDPTSESETSLRDRRGSERLSVASPVLLDRGCAD